VVVLGLAEQRRGLGESSLAAAELTQPDVPLDGLRGARLDQLANSRLELGLAGSGGPLAPWTPPWRL
jgi:hypothetical protein